MTSQERSQKSLRKQTQPSLRVFEVANFYFTSYYLPHTGADTEDITNGETKVYRATSFRQYD